MCSEHLSIIVLQNILETGTTYDSEHEPIPPPVTIEVKKSPRTPPITKEDKSEQVDLSLTGNGENSRRNLFNNDRSFEIFPLGTDPFVKTAQKKKFQRKLFRKVALAVLFLRVLKRRATRTRLVSSIRLFNVRTSVFPDASCSKFKCDNT